MLGRVQIKIFQQAIYEDITSSEKRAFTWKSYQTNLEYILILFGSKMRIGNEEMAWIALTPIPQYP